MIDIRGDYVKYILLKHVLLKHILVKTIIKAILLNLHGVSFFTKKCHFFTKLRTNILSKMLKICIIGCGDFSCYVMFYIHGLFCNNCCKGVNVKWVKKL